MTKMMIRKTLMMRMTMTKTMSQRKAASKKNKKKGKEGILMGMWKSQSVNSNDCELKLILICPL